MKTQKLKKGDKAEVTGNGDGQESVMHGFKIGTQVTVIGIRNSGRFIDCEDNIMEQCVELEHLKPITPAPKRANTNQKSNKMTQTETGKFQTRITDDKTLTRYAKFMKRNKIATRSQLVAEALREYVRNNS